MRLFPLSARPSGSARLVAMFAVLIFLPTLAFAQAPNAPVQPTGMPGTRGSGSTARHTPAQQGDSKQAASGPEERSASGLGPPIPPFAPAPPPPKVFPRPRIGLALGGGGALGLSEIGTLQWLEENHIPVDVIAGTSMGCMISALYSTGHTPDQLRFVMNDKVFTSVFTLSNTYQSQSFRRRQDSRELPNALKIGLKHGVSFRNAILADQGLNAFLDREFFRYSDTINFNALPIPLRCVSTDLNSAESVTFARGSIPDAVRASVSLPGVFQPFSLGGHEYVDGGVLENLPTPTIRSMDPDVVLAVSLPLIPVAKGELDSILGLLGRSFSVAIEGAERQQRKLADVVIKPNLDGFTATDYLKTDELAQRGYQAAEANRAQLIQYRVSDSDWQAYLAHRRSLIPGPPAPVLRVRVLAPNRNDTLAVQRIFAPLVNQPVDTRRIEALLDQVRADGRFQADYTVGYESDAQFRAQQAGAAPLGSGAIAIPVALNEAAAPPPPAQQTYDPDAGRAGGAMPDPQGQARAPNPNVVATLSDHPGAPGLADTQASSTASLDDIGQRPVILVTVSDKTTGPPFLLLGANVQAQAGGITRATVEGILLNQDLGGYGAELRTHVKLGYLTDLQTEYFYPVGPRSNPNRTFFVQPRARLLREPFPIFEDQNRISERQLQRVGGGGDFGVTNGRNAQLRAGFDFAHIDWTREIGADSLPDIHGNTQRPRLQYAFDTQDSALIPRFGVNLVAEFAYLFNTVDSPNAPQLSAQFTFAHRLGKVPGPEDLKAGQQNFTVFVVDSEFGTMFHRNVAQPFRYTLGGPVRLSASSLDQYRGTDYGLLEPALLRRIAHLPQPLGQNIYVGGALEFGIITAPNQALINREDVFLGIVAETPLGVISLGPAVGTNGERKFVFTLGKLF